MHYQISLFIPNFPLSFLKPNIILLPKLFMTKMSESHLCLYYLSLLLLFYISPSSSFIVDDPLVGLVACHPRQTQAFTHFKSEFDTSGCNHGDNSNGVWCDNSTGAITKLQLSGCLTGTLNPNSSLFKLHDLRHLNLSDNNFISSSLPSEFGNLKKLEVLSLFSNGFLGQVPSSFNNLTQLSIIDLGENNLTGSFPHVWNLTKLSVLSLFNNHFSGTLNTNSGLFGLHRLRYLNLGHNNFNSSIPSEFGLLDRLEVLSLSSNVFSGLVYPTISNLTRLTQLHLYENKLIGSFPLVQNLTELSIIDFSTNSFTGTIPSTLLTMPFLSYLDLRENHFTNSFEVLSSSISSSLETLFLGHNHFDAKILKPISKLINLTVLDLSFLNTSHPIDLGLFSSFKYLSYLDLSGDNIYSASLGIDSYIPLTLRALYLASCGIKEFPNILKPLENLELLDITGNGIEGKIPEWLWSLSSLGALRISDNSFNGFEGSAEVLINSSVRVLLMELNNFQELPHLPLSINVISASSNNFSGEIPLSICNRSSLVVLHVSYNNFTGPIPQCLGNFTIVDLRKNNLEGSIPDVFHAHSSLRKLDVGFNRITGKLPRSLLNFSSLMILSVDSNSIEDTFPFWLKALPNLQVLTLCSNKFHGPISPPTQGPLGFPKLRILEIADNKFSGTLPPNYFVDWKASSLTTDEDTDLYMVYDKVIYGAMHFAYVNQMDLQYKGLHMEQAQLLNSYGAIDFSGNLLTGSIPESIGFLKALIALNLSNNAFTGHIPLSLENLKELESLDMSRNQLSGTIPNGLGSLSFLEFINVSHNHLKGEIPQGAQITGQSKSSFEGNAGLCGLPLEKSCFETRAPPIQPQKQEEEEGEDEDKVLNWKGVAIGYGVGVFFGFAVAQIILSYKPEWLAKINGLNKRINH